jgi:hypothetical protein
VLQGAVGFLGLGKRVTEVQVDETVHPRFGVARAESERLGQQVAGFGGQVAGGVQEGYAKLLAPYSRS